MKSRSRAIASIARNLNNPPRAIQPSPALLTGEVRVKDAIVPHLLTGDGRR